MPAYKRNHLVGLIGLALILGCPVIVQAQTHDVIVQVTDASGPNSPITVSGQAHFQEILSNDNVKSRYDLDIQLTNASSKTILAYEVSVQGMPDYGAGFHHVYMTDSFFLPQLEFVPGAQKSETFSDPGWETVPRGGSNPRDMKASFKVLFVEFADGSKFGASHWAATLPEVRQRAVQRMQDIEGAYEASGEAGLRSSLGTALARQDDPQTTFAVMNHLTVTLGSQGPDAAANEIKEFLAVAQTRKDIM